MPTLSILIPAYNEERTIGEVLSALVQLRLPEGWDKEIIVVNDRSHDGTAAVVLAFVATNPASAVVLIEQEMNRGKGAAIHRGIAAATGDWLIVQDADLELDPAEINKVLQPVLLGHADIVYGNRFAQGLPYAGYPMRSYRANRFLTWLSNRTTGLGLGDMEVCYKLMPTAVAKGLRLREQRFGFEPEVTARLAKVKALRWAQVPIRYSARTHDEGKKIGWKDGLRAVWCIVRNV
ncbi:MAG: glycosyltransferase family 2 protein [Flavobacteriales bacterium]